MIFTRRNGLFWGSILILAGVLLLLNNLGYLGGFWRFFWPLLLILLGLWMGWAVIRQHPSEPRE